ncbi:MAG: MFS transporter, partial [Candidatus Bathyarchaeota archaeon]|nr:MFS transporter [Candidatus Bathyarchaeota archaeon]
MDLRSIAPERVSTTARLFLSGAVLNGIGNGVFNVVGQLYFTSLGFTSSSLGNIFMMNAIGAAILTIPMGVLADRYGKKRIMLVSLASVVLSLSILLATKSVLALMVGFFVIGISNAAGVVMSPLYASFFEKDDLDKAFGLWGSLNIVTMSLGSLLGFIPPFLVKNYGLSLQTAYWIFLALGSLFFVAQYGFYLPSIRGMPEIPKGEGLSFTLNSRAFVLKFSLIAVISAVSFGVFFSLFPFYVNQKFGIQSDALGSLFFLSNFVAAGAQAVSPRISKKLGVLNTMVLSIGLATPFYLLVPLVPSFAWLSALYVARVGFRTLAEPLFSSTFMKHLQEDEKSTANSIRMMSMQGGSVLGPWLGGQLMERASLDAPAYIGGGLYAVLAVVTLFLLRDTKGMIALKPLQVV